MWRFFSTGVRNPVTGRFEQTISQKQTLDWFMRSYQKDSIPVDSFLISYSRSGGPGGQNVNKVATKVEMRFPLSKANWLPEYVKQMLPTTSKGDYLVTSTRHRTQHQNYQDCLDKLHEKIVEIVESIPKETSAAKSKHVAQLKKAHNENRLNEKRHASQKKVSRKVSRDY